MNEQEVLTRLRLPARLTAQQSAVFLGFADHDIPILIRTKLLKPLGNAAVGSNCVKYFATAELETLSLDRAWMDRATKVVIEHWRRMNCRRQNRGAQPHAD